MKCLPLLRAYVLMLCCISLFSCSNDEETLDELTDTETTETPQETPMEDETPDNGENADTPPDPPPTNDTSCNGTSRAIYLEKDGLVVLETEDTTIPDDWQKQNSVSGYSGSHYLIWKGSNNFNAPGNGILSYKIKISDPGTYRFQWRSKVGAGTSSTDNNDSWLRIPDADDFYALKNSSKVYPKGSGKSPNPDGSGAEGWFKVYISGTTGWTWSTNTYDNNPHHIYASFNKAGTYTIEVSARSANHIIDRIVMYKDGVNEATATDLNGPLSQVSCN